MKEGEERDAGTSAGNRFLGARRSFVVLNFPGVVENVDIAVESLGGLNKLTSDHFHFNALELAYHRQQNPYSRSTPSRKASNNFMMLHVRRPRKHNQEALGDDDTNGDIDLTGLKIVSASPVTVYDFSSVFDFQYLPMSGNATTGFSSVLDDLVPKDIESAMRWFDPPAESHHPDLFLTPYAFTRSFTSNPYPSVMCKEPERSPAVRALVDKQKVGVRVRAGRKVANICYAASAQFPTHPTPEFIHDADTKYPSPEAQRALEEVSLATILPKFAFYITTGPWGRLWCRYGYDPKTNRDAAKYEVVNMQMGNLRMTANGEWQKVDISRMLVSAEGIRNGREAPHGKNHELSFMYVSGEIPPLRQITYQLIDVQLDAVKNAMERLIDISKTEADTVNGWFQTGAIDTFRELIKEDILKTFRRLNENSDT